MRNDAEEAEKEAGTGIEMEIEKQDVGPKHKARTAYNLFFAHQSASHGELSFGEKSKLISAEYRTLGTEEKMEWVRKARDESQRLMNEMRNDAEEAEKEAGTGIEMEIEKEDAGRQKEHENEVKREAKKEAEKVESSTKKKKAKKKKKANKTAYNLFFAHQSASYEGVSLGEKNTLIGSAYKAMSAEERAEWGRKAEEENRKLDLIEIAQANAESIEEAAAIARKVESYEAEREANVKKAMAKVEGQAGVEDSSGAAQPHTVPPKARADEAGGDDVKDDPDLVQLEPSKAQPVEAERTDKKNGPESTTEVAEKAVAELKVKVKCRGWRTQSKKDLMAKMLEEWNCSSGEDDADGKADIDAIQAAADGGGVVKVRVSLQCNGRKLKNTLEAQLPVKMDASATKPPSSPKKGASTAKTPSSLKKKGALATTSPPSPKKKGGAATKPPSSPRKRNDDEQNEGKTKDEKDDEEESKELVPLYPAGVVLPKPAVEEGATEKAHVMAAAAVVIEEAKNEKENTSQQKKVAGVKGEGQKLPSSPLPLPPPPQPKTKMKKDEYLRLAVTLRPLTSILPPSLERIEDIRSAAVPGKEGCSQQEQQPQKDQPRTQPHPQTEQKARQPLPPPPIFSVVIFPSQNPPFLVPFSWAYTRSNSFEEGGRATLPFDESSYSGTIRTIDRNRGYDGSSGVDGKEDGSGGHKGSYSGSVVSVDEAFDLFSETFGPEPGVGDRLASLLGVSSSPSSGAASIIPHEDLRAISWFLYLRHQRRFRGRNQAKTSPTRPAVSSRGRGLGGAASAASEELSQSRAKLQLKCPSLLEFIRLTLPTWDNVTVAWDDTSVCKANGWELTPEPPKRQLARKNGHKDGIKEEQQQSQRENLYNGLTYTLDEPLRAKIEAVLQEYVKKTPEAKAFVSPVTDNMAPGYSCAVPMGMCFRRVFKRLKRHPIKTKSRGSVTVGNKTASASSGSSDQHQQQPIETFPYYRSTSSILSDLTEIHTNCMLYNDLSSDISDMAHVVVENARDTIAEMETLYNREKKAKERQRKNHPMLLLHPGSRLNERSNIPFRGKLIRDIFQSVLPDESWSTPAAALGNVTGRTAVAIAADSTASTSAVEKPASTWLSAQGWIPQAGDRVAYSRYLHGEFRKGHSLSLSPEQIALPPIVPPNWNQMRKQADSANASKTKVTLDPKNHAYFQRWMVGTIVSVQTSFPNESSSSSTTFDELAPIFAVGIQFHYGWTSGTVFLVHWRPCACRTLRRLPDGPESEGTSDGAKEEGGTKGDGAAVDTEETPAAATSFPMNLDETKGAIQGKDKDACDASAISTPVDNTADAATPVNDAPKCLSCGLGLQNSFLRPAWSWPRSPDDGHPLLKPNVPLEKLCAPPLGVSPSLLSDTLECFDILKDRVVEGVTVDATGKKGKRTITNNKRTAHHHLIKMSSLMSFEEMLSDSEIADGDNDSQEMISTRHGGDKAVKTVQRQLSRSHFLPPWLHVDEPSGERKRHKRRRHESLMPLPNLCLELVSRRLRSGYYRKSHGVVSDIREAYVWTVQYLLYLQRVKSMKKMAMSLKLRRKAMGDKGDEEVAAGAKSLASNGDDEPSKKEQERLRKESDLLSRVSAVRKLFATASVIASDPSESKIALLGKQNKSAQPKYRRPSIEEVVREQRRAVARDVLERLLDATSYDSGAIRKPLNFGDRNPTVKIKVTLKRGIVDDRAKSRDTLQPEQRLALVGSVPVASVEDSKAGNEKVETIDDKPEGGRVTKLCGEKETFVEEKASGSDANDQPALGEKEESSPTQREAEEAPPDKEVTKEDIKEGGNAAGGGVVPTAEAKVAPAIEGKEADPACCEIIKERPNRNLVSAKRHWDSIHDTEGTLTEGETGAGDPIGASDPIAANETEFAVNEAAGSRVTGIRSERCDKGGLLDMEEAIEQGKSGEGEKGKENDRQQSKVHSAESYNEVETKVCGQKEAKRTRIADNAWTFSEDQLIIDSLLSHSNTDGPKKDVFLWLEESLSGRTRKAIQKRWYGSLKKDYAPLQRKAEIKYDVKTDGKGNNANGKKRQQATSDAEAEANKEEEISPDKDTIAGPKEVAPQEVTSTEEEKATIAEPPFKEGGESQERSDNVKPMATDDNNNSDSDVDIDVTQPIELDAVFYESNPDMVRALYGTKNRTDSCPRCKLSKRSMINCRVRRGHAKPLYTIDEYVGGCGDINGLLRKLNPSLYPPSQTSVAVGGDDSAPQAREIRDDSDASRKVEEDRGDAGSSNAAKGAGPPTVADGGNVAVTSAAAQPDELAENKTAVVEKLDGQEKLDIFHKADRAYRMAQDILQKAKRDSKTRPTLSRNFVKLSYPLDTDGQYVFCIYCGLGGDVICCEKCQVVAHAQCAGLDEVPEGDWFCGMCDYFGKEDKTSDEEAKRTREAELEKSSTYDVTELVELLAELKAIRLPAAPVKPVPANRKSPDEYDEEKETENDGEVNVQESGESKESDDNDSGEESDDNDSDEESDDDDSDKESDDDDSDEESDDDESNEESSSAESTEKEEEEKGIVLGTKMLKTFDNLGDFEGRVINVSSADDPYYKVRYDDGDEEDFSEDELQSHISYWQANKKAKAGAEAAKRKKTNKKKDGASVSKTPAKRKRMGRPHLAAKKKVEDLALAKRRGRPARKAQVAVDTSSSDADDDDDDNDDDDDESFVEEPPKRKRRGRPPSAAKEKVEDRAPPKRRGRPPRKAQVAVDTSSSNADDDEPFAEEPRKRQRGRRRTAR